MSLKALPVLFVNLSGEMMYILEQRLRAQNISKEKAVKVINDIVSTMFNESFVKELFKPQEMYTKQALRTVFEKLAHSSIMRLNGSSMDKLYDLMTMVLKYQLCLCPRPEDVIFLTLNHLDGIRRYTQSTPNVLKLVDKVHQLLLENIAPLSSGGFQLLKYTLMSFFQDLQIRVSVLLKEGKQHSNGRFALPKGGPVPYGFKQPGTIRSYGPDGKIMSTVFFPTEDTYESASPPGSLDIEGFRGTNLGNNIYEEHENAEKETSMVSVPPCEEPKEDIVQTPDVGTFEELSFLARLIGCNEVMKEQPEFTLGVFNDDSDVTFGSQPTEIQSSVITIDISQRTEQSDLRKIISDLTIEEADSSDNIDILELLDSASV